MIDQASREELQVNRSLLVGGGVLFGLGGLLGFAGVVLISSALISVSKQLVSRMEQSPTEIARRRWEQTKTAATAGASAGANAWRNGATD